MVTNSLNLSAVMGLYNSLVIPTLLHFSSSAESSPLCTLSPIISHWLICCLFSNCLISSVASIPPRSGMHISMNMIWYSLLAFLVCLYSLMASYPPFAVSTLMFFLILNIIVDMVFRTNSLSYISFLRPLSIFLSPYALLHQ